MGAVLSTIAVPAQTTLRIAAAADLQPVMPAIAQEYEHQTGVKLQVSFGSSSALATQILNRQPGGPSHPHSLRHRNIGSLDP